MSRLRVRQPGTLALGWLTTEHEASSHGQPVLVLDSAPGAALGYADIPESERDLHPLRTRGCTAEDGRALLASWGALVAFVRAPGRPALVAGQRGRTLAVQLPEADAAAIEAEAERRGVSVGEVLRGLLRRLPLHPPLS